MSQDQVIAARVKVYAQVLSFMSAVRSETNTLKTGDPGQGAAQHDEVESQSLEPGVLETEP